MVSQVIKAGTILGGALGGYWCYVYYRHHGFRWAMVPVFVTPMAMGVGLDAIYTYSPQICQGIKSGWNLIQSKI